MINFAGAILADAFRRTIASEVPISLAREGKGV